MMEMRKVLSNLKTFFEKEKETGKPWHLGNVTKRLQVATGVPLTTIKRLVSSRKESVSTVYMRPTSRCKIDEFDQGVVRRTIHGMNGRNEHVTLETLTRKLNQLNIQASKSAIHRTVLKMGFRFYKAGTGRRFLKERQDVVSRRHRYLREVKKARENGDLIVYVDETWVNGNHCVKGEWSDCKFSMTSRMIGDESGSCKFVPSGKGKRLIVLDAGCRDVGLIPGVGEVFVAKSDSGDYHYEMNHKHFFDWWKNTLLPALPGPSTIVVDNASYHSVLTDDSRSPTTASQKNNIKIWLRSRRIPFTEDMVKAELLEIVRRNKPRPKYIIDELAMEAGHMVLRLPPRHCELNPIELVWAKMKGHVARNNSSFKLSNAMVLFEESRALITPAYWNSCEDHVINKIEKELWRIDGVRENEIAPVVISIGEADDTDDDDEDMYGDENEDDEYDSEPLPGGANLADGEEVESKNGEYESDTDDDDDLICSFCGMKEPILCVDDEIEWVFCDACEQWFHCMCLNVRNVTTDHFFCNKCETVLNTFF